MSNYKLEISFSEKALAVIGAAKQSVVIVKHTQESDSNVAWVTFKPFERNTVEWANDFALYASAAEIQGNAKITKLSDCDGQCRVNATFMDGYFASKQPASDIGPNSYKISNEYADRDCLTFGLAQSVSVNGRSFENHPINAVLVPRGNSMVMTPVEKIDVYLEANLESSTVLSRVASKRSALVYSGDVSEITLEYNDVTGSFLTK